MRQQPNHSKTENLSTNQEILESLVRSLPAAVAMLDREMRYLAATDAWLKDYGFTTFEEIRGKSHYEVLPEVPERWKEFHCRALNGEVLSADRDLFVRENGSHMWLRWTIKPWLNLEGEICGILMMAKDITMEIEANLRLEHASRLTALGEMAAGIAHEINNPLAIIYGAVHQLLRGVEKESEAFKEGLQRISRGVQRIDRIVKSMKSLAHRTRVEEREERSIADLIEEVLELNRFRVQSAGVDIRYDIEKACRALVVVNTSEVMQILVNLINNAVDAVEGNEEPWLSIECKERDSWVRVEIKNSGPVPDRTIQEKMMIPFFTTKPPGKGTGLGLGISRAIAEKHGGNLYFEFGAFTTAILEIPRGSTKL